MTSNPVLVDAWRGTLVESRHRGALAVVDADGATVLAIGDIERPVFPRSAVKLLQALPLITTGAADAFRLTDAELALACASHGGEPAHVQTAAAMLAKAGLDAEALECGAHAPSHEASMRTLFAAGGTPNALHNNCSGKHAGFLCVACLLARGTGTGTGHEPRDFARGYVDGAHPVMREVSAAIGGATGVDLARAPQGIDGCSIPTFAVPLRALALGYARVATGVGLDVDRARAAARLRRAAAAAPQMVAGTGRLDTRLAEHFGERVYSKVGAEGVYCAALPERGWGLAIKMDDGHTARAVEVVLATSLQTLLHDPGNDDLKWLHERAHPALVNWRGLHVGRLAPTAALIEALQPVR